jgi:tRNA U34 5-methylaminomethyl-2-thiouridine-forming methyltransferase MnmC
VQEALHVFIKKGLHHFVEKGSSEEIRILEIGFGTGLNALITALEAEKLKVAISYCGVEAYPVSKEEVSALNYTSAFKNESASEVFRKIHEAEWEEEREIDARFRLQKKKMFFSDITAKDNFDLIYFDAFGPRVQPELWEEAIFERMYTALKKDGVLVTYSAKGSVRRAMQAVGFFVERLEGPPGKREMLRATKL